MDLRLENKVALVTDRRPESALPSLQDSRQKAYASVNGRSEKRVQDSIWAILERHLEAKQEPLAANLATAEAAEQTVSRFPAVDILINNLGVYGPKPFETLTDEDWLKIIETNFLSGVRLPRRYLPKVKEAAAAVSVTSRRLPAFGADGKAAGGMAPGVDFLELPDIDLGVNGGRLKLLVAEQLLDISDVGPAFEHERGAGVPEHASCHGVAS
jgi:NAD(P)-dependent dehydrogenase (short-subunit alcohol dehydrogenase family)